MQFELNLPINDSIKIISISNFVNDRAEFLLSN